MQIVRTLATSLLALPVIGIPLIFILGLSILIGWFINAFFLMGALDLAMPLGSLGVGMVLRVIGLLVPPLGAFMAFFG